MKPEQLETDRLRKDVAKLKAERFIKTLQEESANVRPFTSSYEREIWLPKWPKIYNFEQKHGGENFKTRIGRIKQGA